MNIQIGADVPTYAVFDKAAIRTYTAFNPGDAAITVTFTDGFKLAVPAGKQVTATGPVKPILVSIRAVNRTAPGLRGLSIYDVSGRLLGGVDRSEYPPFRRFRGVDGDHILIP